MMRLSEAIRLGSLLVPKARHRLVKVLGGKAVGACALGSALLAIGYVAGDFTEDSPELPTEWITADADLRTRIIIRNDILGWTREQIADWVENEERKLGLWKEDAAEKEKEIVAC